MDATLWLWVAIAAGVLAVLYGVFSMRLILRLPAGTARMQEIAAAIQTGAKAYLNRQYSTILVGGVGLLVVIDRESTRLNSSHLVISYAVFCLKKKKNI